MRTIYKLLFVSCLLLGLQGLAMASVACSANPSNLLANCDFQSGDFTDWLLSGNDVPSQLNLLYGVEGVDPIDGIAPFSGSFQAYFADLVANETTISQSVATAPGATYDIKFWLAQDTATVDPYTNSLSVLFGGTTLLAPTVVPVEGYTLYSYAATATGSSTALSFTLGNDLGEFLLDDITVQAAPVSATPEPSAWLLVASAFGILVWRRRSLTPAGSAR